MSECVFAERLREHSRVWNKKCALNV